MPARQNKFRFTVHQGIQEHYKEHRLKAWELQAYDWAEYTKEDSFHLRSHERVCEAVLSLRSHPASSLIDLGCGPGRFLQLINGRVPWGKLVGIDFCGKMLNLAKDLEVSHARKVNWHKADLELPIHETAIYPFTGFDIATAIFLFDEVENVAACFASARSVLRPGGHLVCAMLDADRERERYDLPDASHDPVTVARPIVIDGDHVPGEYYRLVRSIEQINAIAVSAGFTLLSARAEINSGLASGTECNSIRARQCA
jgi:ubiquinone/menaquinone biosynthesis C-methylase UbiE